MKTLLTVMLFCWLASAGAQSPAPRASTNQTLRIIKIERAVPPYHICVTDSGTVMVSGLPADVQRDFELITRLTASTARETDALKADWRQLRLEKAKVPNRYDYDSPAARMADILTSRENKLYDRQRTLDEDLDELEEATKRFAKKSKVSAIDTGRKYGSYPIYSIVPSR